MSDDIQTVCRRMAELSGEFADNSDATDELIARDNAEDLLVALALSIAFVQDAVTLGTKAEAHIRESEGELMVILQEMGDLEEEEEGEE